MLRVSPDICIFNSFQVEFATGFETVFLAFTFYSLIVSSTTNSSFVVYEMAFSWFTSLSMILILSVLSRKHKRRKKRMMRTMRTEIVHISSTGG